MRKFAIIGMSSFGFYLSKFLSERNHKVMAIDNDEAMVEQIKMFVDKAVIADATKKETLENLNISDFDVVVVSLGGKIDASILVTLYLKELHVKEIIAKAVTEDHGRILDRIGATSVIFPEKDMAYRVARSISNENVLDVIPLSKDISVLEFGPPPRFLGKTLTELNVRQKYNIQIVLIKEVIPDNEMIIPTPDHIIKESDILMGVGKNSDFQKLLNEKI
ncbi:TrkA family potassium uptake protein [candidate division KSB1 bacterium]|nr:TrkA family potassium uptake protein [candidate division KSB1 bacterium]